MGCRTGTFKGLSFAETHLRPIWPTLKLTISASFLESPPLGAFERAMVAGFTVLGSWARSWSECQQGKVFRGETGKAYV